MGQVGPALNIPSPGPERSVAATGDTPVSIEATRPGGAELATLARRLPLGTPVFLTALPGRALDDHLEPIAALAGSGLAPVPHVPVRTLASARALTEFLDRARDAGPTDRLLLVAGDSSRPAGPIPDTLAVLEQVRLADHGIRFVGMAGFPAGHPHLPLAGQLHLLRRKQDAARQAGLRPFVVTQFGFDPRVVIEWLHRIREAGIDCPVRVGMAGPASPATLARFAAKCGVNLPGGRLLSRLKLARSLLAGDPRGMLRALDRAGTASGAFGPVGYHIFTFGGLAGTLDWLVGPGGAPARQA